MSSEAHSEMFWRLGYLLYAGQSNLKILYSLKIWTGLHIMHKFNIWFAYQMLVHSHGEASKISNQKQLITQTFRMTCIAMNICVNFVH